MTACVFVFPGQGSQRVGMARDFYSASASARAVFEEASEALRLDLRAICFTKDERLGLTEYQQPAIITAEIAMLRTLETDYGIRATYCGGHSLGEYAALVAANVLDLVQAVRLVHERGRLMKAAVVPVAGHMIGITGHDFMLDEIEQCLAGLCVDIASVNAPGQVVISGRAEDIMVAVDRIRDQSADPTLKFRPLSVSAPFHCRLMAPAELLFRPVLEAASLDWNIAQAPCVTSNYTGSFHVDKRDDVVNALTCQIGGRVQWLENARALMALKPSRLIEIGPSSVLRHIFVMERVQFSSVTTFREAQVLARRLKAG